MQETWRDGNRFTLLPQGKHFIPAILDAIDRAREFVLVEQYLVVSGELSALFVERMVNASNRGVSVLLLLDGYGGRGLSDGERLQLEKAGVAVRFFNPLALKRLGGNLARDHRKLVVVDRDTAFTGGFCLVDEFISAWYEVAICIRGPVVADWIRLFCELWDSPHVDAQGEAAKLPGVSSHALPAPYRPGVTGRVIRGRGYRYQAIRNSLQQRVMSARKRLWLCTPYFVPARSLRRELVKAAGRGVDVRILVPASDNNDHPGVHFAGQRFYTRLLAADVRIFEFEPSFIHAKLCLVDDWCTIGSCNFDHWSLRWNLEANQEITDGAFADELAALFERNFAASREIDASKWSQRSLWQRCREWLYGSISAWLNRLR